MTLTSRAPDAARTAIARCAALGSLTLALAVAGCTSTPDPAPSPTVTEAVATPTPTPTSTASPKPERPAAMDDVTVEGAIAAATYFVSLFPYAYGTGELTEWTSLSHPECQYCSSVRDEVVEMRAMGQSQQGPELVVTSSEGIEIDPEWFSVRLDLTQGPWVIVDSAGATVREDVASKTLRMEFAVIPDDDGWVVRAVQVDVADE